MVDERNRCVAEIPHNCYMCALYEHPGIYEYEYSFEDSEKQPMRLDDKGYCFYSFDENQQQFDRTAEHDCCVLGMIQTAIVDKELQKAKNLQELSEMFHEKYPEAVD